MLMLLALQAATVPPVQSHEVAAARVCLEEMRSFHGQEFLGRDWFEDSDLTPPDLARIRAEQDLGAQAMKIRWRAAGKHINPVVLDAVCGLMIEAFFDGVLEATADRLDHEMYPEHAKGK